MKPVRVYTTPFCGYCSAAKRLLGQRGVPFEEVNVSGDRDTRAWLAKASGQRTVPQVFFGDESIGGYTELAALDAADELMRRLQS